MKKYFYILVLALYLIPNILIFSQYKVLVSTGEIFVQNDDKWQNIYVNKMLNIDDKVKFLNHSYIVLYDYAGGIYEYRNSDLSKNNSEQIIKVSEFIQSKMNSKKGMLWKFVDYVINEIVSSNSKNEDSIPGAVFRSSLSDENQIKVLNPLNTVLLDENLKIKIISDNLKNNFYFTLYDDQEKTIAKLNINQPEFIFNSTYLNLVPNKNYFWKITQEENFRICSKEFLLSTLSLNQKDSLNSQIFDIENFLGEDKEKAIGKIILAKFYEKNNINHLAMQKYEEALELAPEIESYRKLQTMFLRKNGL